MLIKFPSIVKFAAIARPSMSILADGKRQDELKAFFSEAWICKVDV
jgi:hypothetical protein